MNDTAKMPTNLDKAPRGVSGKQRELYLSLTTEQREVYRYQFDVCGRFAQVCYEIATGKREDPNKLGKSGSVHHDPEGRCEWFALCFQPAAGIVKHPILGDVPTCQLCTDRFELPLIK